MYNFTSGGGRFVYTVRDWAPSDPPPSSGRSRYQSVVQFRPATYQFYSPGSTANTHGDMRNVEPLPGWSASDVAPLAGAAVLQTEVRTLPVVGTTGYTPDGWRYGPVMRQDGATGDLLTVIGSDSSVERGGFPWLLPFDVSYPAFPADVLGVAMVPGTLYAGRTLTGTAYFPGGTGNQAYTITAVAADPITTTAGTFSDAWKVTYDIPCLVESASSGLTRTFKGTYWLSPSVGMIVALQARGGETVGGAYRTPYGYECELTSYSHGTPGPI